jgi:hypothetical protein
MSRRKTNNHPDRGEATRPAEIPMTDLGWTPDGEPPPEMEAVDRHAAGTPGGGAALGGLAGSTVGHGDPEEADLEGALGSAARDGGEAEDDGPQGGPHSGAVGGTPAGKRSRGRDH